MVEVTELFWMPETLQYFQVRSHIPFWKHKSAVENAYFEKKAQLSRCIGCWGGSNDVQQSVACSRRRGRARGVREWIIRVGREPQSADMHDDVMESQLLFEKPLLQPLLKMTGEQNVVPEDCPEAEGIDISQNSEDEGGGPFLCLVAKVALMQGQRSYFWLQD